MQNLVGLQQQTEYNSLNIEKRVQSIVETLQKNINSYERLNNVKSTLELQQFREHYLNYTKIKENLSHKKLREVQLATPLV